MVELHKQEMEPKIDIIFPKLRKSIVKCRTRLCAEHREISENQSPVSLKEFMMDAVGASRLREKGDGHRCPGNLLLVFVYLPGFYLGWSWTFSLTAALGIALVHRVL